VRALPMATRGWRLSMAKLSELQVFKFVWDPADFRFHGFSTVVERALENE